jgi:alpha/beta superfamily hydrolase
MPQVPVWIKPAVWGAVAGSVVTMILGFSYGGWVTSSTADRVAKVQADTAVTTALVPLCIAQSKADGAAVKKMGELKALASSYDQRDFVTKTGWATVPGSADPNRDVAEACAAALLKTAEAK